MRARIPFDTLAYANRLKAAGVESSIAEAQAAANAEMLASLTTEEGLATRSDVLSLKNEIHQQITETRTELQQQITELRGVFREEITHNRTDMERIESKLERHIVGVRSELKEDIQKLETRLTLRIGGIVLGGLTLLSVIHTVLLQAH